MHTSVSVTYIVLLEECEVANYSNPHQECGGSQQDATQIIRGHILSGEEGRYFLDTGSTFTRNMTIAVLMIN